GIHPEHRVDHELLAVAPLVAQNAMMPERAQPEQRDPVAGHVARPAPSWPQPAPHRAATRTASALAATECTRTHQAPAAAASAVTATVASSRAGAGRGSPAVSRSRLPRKLLRDAPTRTGNAGPGPGRATSPSRASRAQLCLGSFANPRPGSRMIADG